MEKYINRSSIHQISYYEINSNSITVWFKGNPRAYTYPEYLTGSHDLARLKSKAQSGKGLSA
jgi:hypothetical protein